MIETSNTVDVLWDALREAVGTSDFEVTALTLADWIEEQDGESEVVLGLRVAVKRKIEVEKNPAGWRIVPSTWPWRGPWREQPTWVGQHWLTIRKIFRLLGKEPLVLDQELT